MTSAALTKKSTYDGAIGYSNIEAYLNTYLLLTYVGATPYYFLGAYKYYLKRY